MDSKQEGISQVGLTLMNHFDSVYFVDLGSGKYTDLVPLKLFKDYGAKFEGDDFFSDSMKFMSKCIHPNDMDIVKQILDKDAMKKRLSLKDTWSVGFRLLLNEKVSHIRHVEFMCPDKVHALCCLENIEEEFLKKKEEKRILESAERMARFDVLTGVRNKNAFQEYSDSISKIILTGNKGYHFALIMCDMNDLKLLNDTRGHNFGDEAIQRTSRMICEIFVHSPVFRIGGDEFVVILTGNDYVHRDKLLNALKQESFENKKSRSGPVVACGLAVYDPEIDKDFASVLDRADKQMYQNKEEIKSLRKRNSDIDLSKTDATITDERKRKLDGLFGALYTVSDGGYVFLNDMYYDFSRWSLHLVVDLGASSEYLYHAHKYFEEHIHPDELEAFKEVMDVILRNPDAEPKPLTYRLRKADGTYTLVTFRGFVLNDKEGNPEYFGGIIVPK